MSYLRLELDDYENNCEALIRNKVITAIETKRLPVLDIELFENANIKSCQVT